MKKIPVRQIKTNQKEPGLAEHFSIRKLSHIMKGNDMVQELHRHDYFFILLILKGKGDHEIDFIPYKIADHTIFFMRPGGVHQLSLKKGSTGYLMQFKPDFYFPHDHDSGHILRKASHKNYLKIPEETSRKLHSILENIHNEFENKNEGFRDVIKANLSIFFIELMRRRQHKKPGTGSKLYATQRMEELMDLISKNITIQKNPSGYASMLNLSPYQLNSITKSTLGKTTSEIINEQIILEAKRYLLATPDQISQISDYLGYDDVSYFIRFFKKHTGYTPETFRNNFK